MPAFQTKLFINGEFTTALSGTTYKVNHPARDQLDAMVEVQSACPEDIYKALEAASVAQPAWKSSLRSERLRSLGRLLQEFKADIVETLDPKRSTYSIDAELAISTTILNNTSGLLESTIDDAPFSSEIIFHQEVCLAEGTPNWKYPLLSVVAKLAPILASGKTAVIKAPFKSPLTALYIARLIVIAGFPPGTINILSADWVTVKSAFYDSTGKAYPSVTLVDTDTYYSVGDVNPRLKEDECSAITYERKYYEFRNAGTSTFVKRSLSPGEWGFSVRGDVVVPRMGMERLKNEAAAIDFVRRNTCIPVPTIRASFEDNGRYYLITDGIRGITMDLLPADQKALVIEELQGYLAILHTITSKRMGGILGDACLPWRVAMALPHEAGKRLKFNHTAEYEYVLCHNDLNQSNIIVDEETLKINGIIDWEYAGFYPKEFEGAYYERRGPAGAMEGEIDDVSSLLSILDRCTEGSLIDDYGLIHV